MEPDNVSNSSMNCEEYKQQLTNGLLPYEVLRVLTPVSDQIWTDREDGWRNTFKVSIGLLGSIYLVLGLISIVLLIKKDCVRLSTKTFFAVYLTIAILCFSRALLLVLDPYDLLGFISDHFNQWIIITRIIGAFGFPSLVASYTLMVFTLLRIAKANPGKQWYHRWKFVVPVVAIPYVIALMAETVGYLAPYPGLLSILICEVFFGLWGITVCITYLIAGSRLMHQLRKRERNTVRMSSSAVGRSMEELATQTDFAAQEYQRHHRNNRRTARKIAIITYGTVFVAFVYSLVTFGNTILVGLFIFKDCLAFMGVRGNSVAWLIIYILTRITEIILATIMLYSITDVSGIVKFVSRMFLAMCCCKRMRVTGCSRQSHPLSSMKTTTSQVSSLPNSHHKVGRSMDDIPDTMTTTNTTDQPELTQENMERNERSSLRESGIRLEEIMVDCQQNHMTINNTTSPNSLWSAAKGESSLESNAVQEQTQASKECVSALCAVSGTQSESTDTPTQTNLESCVGTAVTVEDSALVDFSSLVHTLEHTSSVALEAATQTVELNDKACQTEPSASVKPVPKPRRFAPKSPRERRERLHQQKQLPKVLSNSKKLWRKQTV